jgi:MATE family multidrug resistance protein
MAIPLILSTGAWSVQHFVDRMFLTWYSPTAIAASVPAGVLNFAIMSLFIGTAGYVNTFVAQYYGAGRRSRIGPSLWQGLYVSLIGGVVILPLALAAEPIFRFVGHEAAIQEQEAVYFRILCYGAFFPVASSALTGFFSGRGKNWPVMCINTAATSVNIVLDYALIFGRWGLPEMGIGGAALATVAAGIFSFAAYIVLICRPSLDRIYHTIRGWRLDISLLKRLIRFGLPSGVQFLLDVTGFTAFLLMVGRLGMEQLAATNIAFNINTLAFMPMIGFGIAISVLVGQYLGDNKPELAERSIYSGAHLTFFYMTLLAAAYVLVPDVFIAAFSAQADPVQFEPIRRISIVLLRFVALYTLFDTANIIFASAIKGAGDTRFVMVMIVAVSLGVLVIPSYIALILLKANIYVAWVIVSAYIIILGASFFFRFLTGKWKHMRVIERVPHALPPQYPEVPSSEYEP